MKLLRILGPLILLAMPLCAQQMVSVAQQARTTGTITTSSTSIPVSTVGYSVVTVTVNGTYAGITVNFEFSDDGGTTYYSDTCTRTDSNVQESSEALPSNQSRAWDCGVFAATNFRVRSSAYTSGTANIGITLSAASIEPAQTVSVSGTVPVSGTVAVSNVNANGQATMANSAPVAIASDQSAVPVKGSLSSNGAAASSNREADLPCIARTDFQGGTAATAGRDLAPDCSTDGALAVNVRPAMRPASYHASKSFAGSSTTDNAVLPGNASNTVLVTGIYVSCTQTTAGMVTLNIIKRSTADTAGTSASMTAVPDDSNYSAAVSAPLSYTGTGPTAGTSVGNLDTYQLGCMASGTASPNDLYIMPGLQFKPIVLRGTAQQVAVNFNNAAITGGTVTVTFAWQEITTITP